MKTKEELKYDLKQILDIFFNSNQQEISFDTIPYAILRESLNELWWKEDPEGDFDTMGWEIAFWVDFTKEDLRISISGSLHYGNIKIRKK